METNLQYKNKYLKYKKKYLNLQKKMKGGVATTAASYITTTVHDKGSDCQQDIVEPASDQNVYTIITKQSDGEIKKQILRLVLKENYDDYDIKNCKLADVVNIKPNQESLINVLQLLDNDTSNIIGIWESIFPDSELSVEYAAGNSPTLKDGLFFKDPNIGEDKKKVFKVTRAPFKDYTDEEYDRLTRIYINKESIEITDDVLSANRFLNLIDIRDDKIEKVFRTIATKTKANLNTHIPKLFDLKDKIYETYFKSDKTTFDSTFLNFIFTEQDNLKSIAEILEVGNFVDIKFNIKIEQVINDDLYDLIFNEKNKQYILDNVNNNIMIFFTYTDNDDNNYIYRYIINKNTLYTENNTYTYDDLKKYSHSGKDEKNFFHTESLRPQYEENLENHFKLYLNKLKILFTNNKINIYIYYIESELSNKTGVFQYLCNSNLESLSPYNTDKYYNKIISYYIQNSIEWKKQFLNATIKFLLHGEQNFQLLTNHNKLILADFSKKIKPDYVKILEEIKKTGDDGFKNIKKIVEIQIDEIFKSIKKENSKEDDFSTYKDKVLKLLALFNESSPYNFLKNDPYKKIFRQFDPDEHLLEENIIIEYNEDFKSYSDEAQILAHKEKNKVETERLEQMPEDTEKTKNAKKTAAEKLDTILYRLNKRNTILTEENRIAKLPINSEQEKVDKGIANKQLDKKKNAFKKYIIRWNKLQTRTNILDNIKLLYEELGKFLTKNSLGFSQLKCDGDFNFVNDEICTNADNQCYNPKDNKCYNTDGVPQPEVVTPDAPSVTCLGKGDKDESTGKCSAAKGFPVNYPCGNDSLDGYCIHQDGTHFTDLYNVYKFKYGRDEAESGIYEYFTEGTPEEIASLEKKYGIPDVHV